VRGEGRDKALSGVRWRGYGAWAKQFGQQTRQVPAAVQHMHLVHFLRYSPRPVASQYHSVSTHYEEDVLFEFFQCKGDRGCW
jgi:hypothetical protein